MLRGMLRREVKYILIASRDSNSMLESAAPSLNLRQHLFILISNIALPLFYWISTYCSPLKDALV